MGIDFVGPLNPVTTKGNKYILTISDYFTKFVDAIPLPDKSAHHVAGSLFQVMLSQYCRIVTIHLCIHLCLPYTDLYENGHSKGVDN